MQEPVSSNTSSFYKFIEGKIINIVLQARLTHVCRIVGVWTIRPSSEDTVEVKIGKVDVSAWI